MNARTQFAWSVRREVWEHRAIWIAPLAVAAIVLIGFAVAANHWSGAMRTLGSLPVGRRWIVSVVPYGLASSAILAFDWLTAVSYSLDALNGERRDRSILFWKSMPVSDVITVLAKAAIPLAVLPAIAVVVALATQLLMIGEAATILAINDMPASLAWTQQPWLTSSVAMVYGMAAHALWFAPIFGYLLLVSAAARRSTWLWAALPPLGAAVFEAIAFGSGHVAAFLKHRLLGGLAAFRPDALKTPITQFSQLDPVAFFALPGLWLGLAFAAACIAAAIRLRRYREPT